MNPASGIQNKRQAGLLALVVVVVALAAGEGCGGDQPQSALRRSDIEAVPKGSPPPLRRLRTLSGRILEGGPEAFKRQIESLRGYPVVVNKWASWCGPCRFEFPFFQRLARKHEKRIAFLGVDSLDSEKEAAEFLERFPVPYPSFFDPKAKVAAVFRGDRVFPTSAFYDSKGELVFTKQGGYSSEAALAKDIRQYAR